MCHKYGRRRSMVDTLHCLRIQDLWESYDLYTWEYEELGVESARMLMLGGNEYVGVDGD